MTQHPHESIDPRTALDDYLAESESRDNAPSTLYQKERKLGFFVEWCAEEGIETLDALSGRDIWRFTQDRFDDHAPKTIRTQLSYLQDFLSFCARIDAVDARLVDSLDVPHVDEREHARETLLAPNVARDILTYLDTYERASLDHILMLLVWATGARIGALHSLDVDDVDRDSGRLSFVHRPMSGTRLKNGARSERVVNLRETVVDRIGVYLDQRRTPQTDSHDRHPLFTSSNGRLSKSCLSSRVYYWTTPCHIGKSCPSGNEPAECEHEGTYRASLSCPHSHRPHDLRRGAITAWLNDDTPTWAVSERCDVTEDTLATNYDARSLDERADARRDYFT